jgi:hypothetical protein
MATLLSSRSLRWLGLAVVVAVFLPACGTLGGGTKPTGTKPTTGTTPPPSGGSCRGDQEFQLTLTGSMDDPCAFNPVVVSNSHCQLLRMDAEATGAAQAPPSVIFEKNGSPFDRSANGSSGGWSATTTHHNCTSGPGCADATYALKLAQQENPILCAEYGSVTLRLVLR